MKKFSKDDGIKLVSGRQTILCFPSFAEKEKRKGISYSAYNRSWHQKDGITLQVCNIEIIKQVLLLLMKPAHLDTECFCCTVWVE